MSALRHRAKQRLAAEPPTAPLPEKPEDVARLVEELRLHQVELEMQNQELEETYAALEATMDRYVELYDFAPVGYLTLDEKGVIDEINLTGAGMLGHAREGLVGKPFSAYLARDEQESFFGHLHRVVAYAEKVVTELKLKRRKKPALEVQLESVVATGDQGGAWRCHTVMSDITERKRGEQQLRQREAELARLARLGTVHEMGTVLAHQLNQPLAAIVSYAEGALRRYRSKDRESDPLLDVLEETARLAKQAGEIVRAMRQFVGNQPINGDRVDVNDVVGEAVRLLSAEASNRSITITTHLLGRLPTVKGSFVQLEQVVLNMMLNGMEAMANAEGPRVLTLRTFANENREVELTVSDTGTGLPQQEIATHMFDAFVTTKEGGLGMGLSIGRTIVEAHKGRIWVDSNPDRGATFHVALPIASGEGDSAGCGGRIHGQ